MGAQIRHMLCKCLICKESENRIFRFPESKNAMDGLFTISSFIDLLLSMPLRKVGHIELFAPAVIGTGNDMESMQPLGQERGDM